LRENRELVVIGAGPAGMSAAIAASASGVDVVVLDQRKAPGGQIYRNIEAANADVASSLGTDYLQGADLVKQFRESAAEYRPDATVWEISVGLEVYVSGGSGARIIQAQRVVIATGALERPFPIPGWTLPGVMAAGAAQSLLKQDGLLPEGSVVLAGTGPLILLLACQYLDMGVNIAALLETTHPSNRKRALAYLPQAVTAGKYLWKGATMLKRLKHHGVRHIHGVEALRALGEDRLRQVEFRVGSSEQIIDTSLLLLHQGVVPDVNLTGALGCAMDWDNQSLCFRPRLDPWGSSSVAGISVVGDGAAIIGSQSAIWAGKLAGLDAACRFNHIDQGQRDAKTQKAQRALKRSLKVRPFLETLYRPANAFRIPEQPETIVCRCEEVEAGCIRKQIECGAMDPNAIKSRLRCGMGPCQGRYCGLTVSEIIAAETGKQMSEIGYYRLRPPVKPVPISDILALATGELPAEVKLPDPFKKKTLWLRM
jgi:thioredoxin reductase